MPMSIARLRAGIIGGAIVLILVLAGFFVYARYKAHRLISDLPGKFGATVVRSSDGFTYSQSVKGRTAFTIHASKAVQFAGGSSATLHDVVITLNGAQGDRNDRISGSEFNYDQKAGIVSAQGEVQIDFQGAGLTGTPAGQSGKTVKSPNEPGTIHVKTSGLVFDQKTQVATTAQYVEFTTPKGAGHSTGATYDVQKGLLVLNSGVELTSSRNGKPIKVAASHAEFLRNSLQAFLLNPVSDYQAEHTTADQAIVYFRKDGSAEHIDAQGHIHLTTDDGRQLTAGKAKILLDERSQPTRADASGGLNFTSTQSGENNIQQQLHGNAVEATLQFGPTGALHHAQARNAVSFVDQQQGLPDDPNGSATRELRASTLDIDFVEDTVGHAVADKVLAAGGATAVLHTIRTKLASQNTTIKGDQLLATLQNGHAITSLHGTGHTSVTDISPTGANSVSSGDVLQVNFAAASNRPINPARPRSADMVNMEATQIQSVAQEGNVVLVQTAAPSPGKAAALTRATANRADYDAATQLLRLEGSPRISDGTTDLSGNSIAFHRDTNVADVAGNVKATYLEPRPGQQTAATSPGFGSQGPTHIIANAATLDQSHGKAVFRGQARLWQGANSVTAPVIELERNPEFLKAYGETSGAASVTAVISSSSGPQRQAGVFRVHSRQLLYSESDQKATFIGAVAAQDETGTIHCDRVEAFLVASGANQPLKPENADGTGPSKIDRIVASGHVVLEQPGRRGIGEKLIYTAKDEQYILTGTSATLPHLYDQTRGDVSGEALIFNSRGDSVSVTGGQSRAVTNTRTTK